jgi:hypothetical protein
MSFSSKITIKYDSEWDCSPGDEFLPEEHITMQVPAQDLNTIQLFHLWRNFLLSIGHNQNGIDKGALSLVFSEFRDMEDMRKAAEEYDLKLTEDIAADEVNRENHWEERYWKIKHNSEKQIRDLKAKISRLENPDNPNYTDEEMEAMCADKVPEVSKRTLETAYQVCKDCGNHYGEYVAGLSSIWSGTCDVCGQEKPVTESRDYNYLKKGIEKLSKE